MLTTYCGKQVLQELSILQALSQDKESLLKLKKTVKDIQQSGTSHVNLELELSKALDRLGDTTITREDEDDDIGAAFQKFAVVTKELSALMRNMVSLLIISSYSFANILFFFPVTLDQSFPLRELQT